MKMDHHCPWINNCVGHFNHGHFVGFLFFAVLGCAQAAVTLAMTLFYGLNRSWYRYYGTGREPNVILTIWSLLMVMFALGLAIGVVLAVGALFYFQVFMTFLSIYVLMPIQRYSNQISTSNISLFVVAVSSNLAKSNWDRRLDIRKS